MKAPTALATPPTTIAAQGIGVARGVLRCAARVSACIASSIGWHGNVSPDSGKTALPAREAAALAEGERDSIHDRGAGDDPCRVWRMRGTTSAAFRGQRPSGPRDSDRRGDETAMLDSDWCQRGGEGRDEGSG